MRVCLPVHQVRYFLAVARTLNFTRAAEECNVAQPSLTRAIKLLEGEYPDYKPVINYNGMIPVEVERVMFSTLMRRISILTSDDYKSVVLNFKENELMVTITNPEIGESRERIMIPAPPIHWQ